MKFKLLLLVLVSCLGMAACTIPSRCMRERCDTFCDHCVSNEPACQVCWACIDNYGCPQTNLSGHTCPKNGY